MPPIHAPRPHQLRGLMAIAAALGALIGSLGCGDDVASKIVVTQENLNDAGLAATEVAIRAIALDGIVAGGFIEVPPPPAPGHALRPESAPSPGSGGGTPLDLCDSGSAVLSGNEIQFAACDVTGICVLDGGMTVDVSSDGDSVQARAQDLLVDCVDAPPVLLDGDELDCDDVLTTPSCSYQISDFSGTLTGSTFHVERVGISPTGPSAWNISGIVVSPAPDTGRVYFSTQVDIGVSDCPGGVPASGMMDIYGSGPDFGTVQYLSCDQYEDCFAPEGDLLSEVCTQYDWADLLNPI